MEKPNKHTSPFPFVSTSPVKSAPRHYLQHFTTDEWLWDAFRKGDEAAFITIYNEFCPSLFHFGCQLSQDREWVKDCLQDLFIYLRRHRAGLGNTNAIKPYLIKALRRRMLDELKKKNKEKEHRERFMFEQFPVELSSESKFIHQQMEKDLIERLNKVLATLEVKEREAVYLFYYQGLTYEQIAGLFEFSHVSSARRLIYRALSNLRKMMVLPIFILLVHADEL